MDDASPHIVSEKHFDFHIEEFKLLKEEIAQNHRTHFQIEIFTISATGLLVSFIIANKSLIDTSGLSAMWWSPLLVLYFGLIWSRSYIKRSFEIGKYLAKVEARYGLADLGWERTHAPLRQARGGSISRPKKILWVGLFIFFGLLALRFGMPPLWRAIGAS